MKTLDVIFRVELMPTRTRGGYWEVTAIFPTLPGTADPWTACCYAHVGQHGACHRDWYRTTRPADPDEYAELLRELQGIYGDSKPEDVDTDTAVALRVVKRWTQHHDAARKAALEDARK